ncbi:ergothioneine biosynthesis glutamate--cysteine ligase EgtA [Dactylosporangium sp. AC04546]|uniref:ergothioneine biosynthesis glutamate--cysteine ligase EgtA n=1 Tax=Dactylosporangium sp. AC04546 TaxID=2862460 RepID=UPI001EE0F618|nr:ergothioneine biosynthesis glutamate--cysteine ligase EgtA [Dactylosporangium sp. AC04546]WVK87572.1 ergothioneine biosynthesis glutamate--cysteine ligase EgtA [Dactylosporangium sp. AC04546]
MATLQSARKSADSDAVISEIEQAEGYIASICFKTGPPETVGVEIEYTVHDQHDPSTPIDRERLCQALGDHAPGTLRPGSPALPLRHGSAVTLEPGGQVELSSRPHPTLTGLHTAVNAELDQLETLLGQADLRVGETGADPHRRPRRLLDTPRYHAMESAFERRGVSGKIMMCSTAGLQVCLDAGPPERLAERWAAVHDVGPPLLALFANSPRLAGTDTGWASARQRVWRGIDPTRTRPVPVTDDPAAAWARYALDATVLCVRQPDGPWTVPAGVTFAGWIRGELPRPPTYADLDYHLSTLFPPVRPRGYLEIRYLDTQPGRGWFAPAALLHALLDDPVTTDKARDVCAPAAGRWVEAARDGLADAALHRSALALRDLALSDLDLPPHLLDEVTEGSARNG